MDTMANPLLQHTGLPAYDRIEPAHIEAAVSQLVARGNEILAALETGSHPDWDSLMVPLEEIDLLFEYGWSPIGHLLSVANAEALRAAHDANMPRIVEFSLALRQSPALYRKLCALRDGPQWSALAAAQQRIITRSIQSAELSGIKLEGAQRSRFNEVEQALSMLGTKFSNNLLDATKAWSLDLTERAQVEGLPQSLLRLAAAAWSAAHPGEPAAEAALGPWRITLDAPSFGPFMEHCRSRALREQAYRAQIVRAAQGETDNTPLIAEILRLKHEKARLLGFANFAEVSLAQKMAGSVTAVEAMHERLLEVALPGARQELAELQAWAANQGQTEPLAHWDVAFWAERMREARYAFTDEELRPYFSLDRVLDGLFALCHRLFGITMSAADGEAPVWNPDVRFYAVSNEHGTRIASFYLDPYSRPENKRGGAWMNDCIQRSVGPFGTRLPVAHLVCNGTPPSGGVPSLMTFREVETLFHEFGHGLQHMLTTVDFRDAAGIAGVEWDAVELPSQFMENWCLHRPTLMGMARHYETGAPLPEALFDKLRAAKTWRAASAMVRQLHFGMTDLALHAGFDPDGPETAFAVEQRIAARTSPMPPLPENRFLCSFSHIFAGGYAAGYYSYKWAEVLSADAFAAFEEAGLDDADAVASTGRRYRDTILAQGGSRHPLEIFRDFRGRDPDPAALLRHHGLKAA
jgi:oligopeptidase A